MNETLDYKALDRILLEKTIKDRKEIFSYLSNKLSDKYGKWHAAISIEELIADGLSPAESIERNERRKILREKAWKKYEKDRSKLCDAMIAARELKDYKKVECLEKTMDDQYYYMRNIDRIPPEGYDVEKVEFIYQELDKMLKTKKVSNFGFALSFCLWFGLGCAAYKLIFG